MILTNRQRDWLVQEAERSLPREACGILVGSPEGERVTQIFRSVNLAASPEREFGIDPVLVARLGRRLRGGGNRILGCYHSHPSGSRELSTGDRREAWPLARYLVLAVTEGKGVELVCWRWEPESGTFREEKLDIVEEEE
jgi:proteasome lid subunit RPN8/RPN11